MNLNELSTLRMRAFVEGWNHYVNGKKKDLGIKGDGWGMARSVHWSLGMSFSDETTFKCPNITIQEFDKVLKVNTALESFDSHIENNPTDVVEYFAELRDTLLDIFKENLNG